MVVDALVGLIDFHISIILYGFIVKTVDEHPDQFLGLY
jgi:hypothetical protein